MPTFSRLFSKYSVETKGIDDRGQIICSNRGIKMLEPSIISAKQRIGDLRRARFFI